jgi:hypothetical protein
MTPNPKPRPKKGCSPLPFFPANAVDPIFAAIAEHTALSSESARLEKPYVKAWAEAVEKFGPITSDWQGDAPPRPLYDRWDLAERAAREAAHRMAKTEPTTFAGIEAVHDHISATREWAAWIPIAVKTAHAALARMRAA